MNIFFLDTDPTVAASYLSDKHVNKMLVESAQMLSTTAWVLNSTISVKIKSIYSPTHEGHPCCKWLREGYENYKWLINHAIAINQEIVKRFGNKNHRSYKVIEELYAELLPNDLFDYKDVMRGLTPPTLVMPERFMLSNLDKDLDMKRDMIHYHVACYRNYYANGKQNLLDYSRSTTPEWIQHYQQSYGQKSNSSPKETQVPD